MKQAELGGGGGNKSCCPRKETPQRNYKKYKFSQKQSMNLKQLPLLATGSSTPHSPFQFLIR